MVKVGAATEAEMNYKKAKLEDALAATKAAVEEGIVAGGGTALILAIPELDKLTGLSADEQLGVKIVKRALEEPLRQIVANAGKEGSVVLSKIKSYRGKKGYDVVSNEYTDMVKAGIIDPVKVVRSAVQNAISASAMLLTTETVITDLPEKKDEMPGAGMAGGMPGGGMGMM